MLACLLADWPLRRFARGDVPACLAWAVTYQLIGVLGGSLFAEPWEGVLAAVVLTVVLSGAPALWHRVRRPDRTGGADRSDGTDGPDGSGPGRKGRRDAAGRKRAEGPRSPEGQET